MPLLPVELVELFEVVEVRTGLAFHRIQLLNACPEAEILRVDRGYIYGRRNNKDQICMFSRASDM